MKKAQDGHKDSHKNLMIYRSAPLQNGLSPAQLLMGRRLRTNLIVKQELLTPIGAQEIKDERKKESKNRNNNMTKGQKSYQSWLGMFKDVCRRKSLHVLTSCRQRMVCLAEEIVWIFVHTIQIKVWACTLIVPMSQTKPSTLLSPHLSK